MGIAAKQKLAAKQNLQKQKYQILCRKTFALERRLHSRGHVEEAARNIAVEADANAPE